MASLQIKGVRIGAGRPKTIVSLMDGEPVALLARAQQAVAAGAELLEWRCDYTHDLHDVGALAQVAARLGEVLPATPLIATFRSRGQGGEAELPAAAQVALCEALVGSGGVDLLDIELSLGDEAVRSLVERAHGAGAHAIVSHHDFAATPGTAWMRDCLRHMAELGADIPKLAVMAQSRKDCLRLMEATAQVAGELDQPLLTMAMGECGTLSRLAGESFGSALTFCALGRPSAPGQVGLAQARVALDALHDALAVG